MARDDAGRGHGAGVARLYVAMLSLQFGYAGFHVVSRLALNMGVSKLVFPVYRNLIALCLLARPRCRRGASTAAAPHVFVAVYQPVQTLLVAVMASLILGERFYLGGVAARRHSFFLRDGGGIGGPSVRRGAHTSPARRRRQTATTIQPLVSACATFNNARHRSDAIVALPLPRRRQAAPCPFPLTLQLPLSLQPLPLQAPLPLLLLRHCRLRLCPPPPFLPSGPHRLLLQRCVPLLCLLAPGHLPLPVPPHAPRRAPPRHRHNTGDQLSRGELKSFIHLLTT
ncbi:hypothetical protein SEVIR_7G334525v4 [Setaria viridis]